MKTLYNSKKLSKGKVERKLWGGDRKGRLYLVFEYVEKNLLEILEDMPSGIDVRNYSNSSALKSKTLYLSTSKSNRFHP